MLRLSGLFLIFLAASCGGSSLSPGPCDQVPPDPSCSLACDPLGANTCPGGFYCTPDATCYAQCRIGENQCSDGFACTTDGKCLPEDQVPNPGGGDCPRVAFTAKPTTPSILLLLDRSGSMNNNFPGGGTRWSTVRDALVNTTDGIVTRLESKAYFGSMIYQNLGDQDAGCPELFTRPRTLNNAAAIRQALQASPNSNSGTPTAKSIQAAVASFTSAPAPADSPKIIVLATDGRPNKCTQPRNQGDPAEEALVEATAGTAYTQGIRTIPLSVAGASNDDQQAHLQRVANRGAGVQTGQPNAPLYKGDSPAELRAAFEAIIGGAISCDLTVTGNITQDQARGGDVRLNDRKLTFGTEWELVGSNIIRLLGATCNELKTSPNPKVDGTFECGTVIE